MNSKKIIFITSMLLSLMLLTAAAVITFDISELEAEKLEDREKAAERIRQNHKNLIRQLIDLASKKTEKSGSKTRLLLPNPYDSKHLSILLLGDLRATEAIPLLLDNITYLNPKYQTPSYLSAKDKYPAVESLIKIGIPAVQPVIEKLGTYDKASFARKNCCRILKEILGLRLAQLKLQIAIEETKEPTVKQNLTSVLPYFKTEKEPLKATFVSFDLNSKTAKMA